MFVRWLKRLMPIVLIGTMLVTACSQAPSKYDQIQEETSGRKAPAAVDKQAQKGGTFNQFFPAAEEGYEVVPAQEKKGFAEYKLKKDGTTLAMLTINDTLSVPAAAAKYKDATEILAGYPMVTQGTTATGILVNDRYQVKVLSRDESFTEADRAAWLKKFDLKGLAKLEAQETPATRAAAAAEKAAKQEAKKAARQKVTTKPNPTPEPKAVPELVPQPAS